MPIIDIILIPCLFVVTLHLGVSSFLFIHLFLLYCYYQQQKMNSDIPSESQAQTERSNLELGLNLTQKIININIKTKLKQINPTLIYQWDGQTINNQPSGKGTFYVRHSQTNQLIYQCQVKKWINSLPQGYIKVKKVNLFTTDQITDYKLKQIHLYQGLSLNLKKHGKGTYTLQQFYSSGKVKKTIINGQWNNDILVQGNIQTESGKKELNLNKNMEWSKSAKSIVLSPQKNTNRNQRQDKEKKNKESLILKNTTNLMPEPMYKQKYLDPNKIR